MNCLQEFCIYQQDGKCMLKTIEINETGMCANCICADIDKTLLAEAKRQLLIKYSE